MEVRLLSSTHCADVYVQMPCIAECQYTTNAINTRVERSDRKCCKDLVMVGSANSVSDLGDGLGCTFLGTNHDAGNLMYSIVDSTASMARCQDQIAHSLEALLREMTEFDQERYNGLFFDIDCRVDTAGAVHLVLASPESEDTITHTKESPVELLAADLACRQLSDDGLALSGFAPS